MSASLARIPWLTVGFVGAAALASAWPTAFDVLIYRRDAAQAGEAWRAVTAQLVHGSLAMGLLDLFVVLACGALLERRARRVASAAFAGSLLLVGATVHWAAPQVAVFDGSSGVAAALFTATALWLALTTESPAARALASSAVLLAFGKAALEVGLGLHATAVHLPAGAQVLPAAHLAGCLAGLLAVAVAGRAPDLGRGLSRGPGAAVECAET